MPLYRGSMAPLVRCIPALLVGFTASVFAVEPLAPDEDAIKLDQAVQVLKDEATLFQGDAQVARMAYLFPPESRLTVYLSNSLDDLLVEKVSLRIDDREPIEHEYDDFSSRALLVDGALQQIALMNIDRGAHQLEIKVSGRYAKDESDVEASFVAGFNKLLGASDIEIELVKGKRRGPPVIEMREWRPDPQ